MSYLPDLDWTCIVEKNGVEEHVARWGGMFLSVVQCDEGDEFVISVHKTSGPSHHTDDDYATLSTAKRGAIRLAIRLYQDDEYHTPRYPTEWHRFGRGDYTFLGLNYSIDLVKIEDGVWEWDIYGSVSHKGPNVHKYIGSSEDVYTTVAAAKRAALREADNVWAFHIQ